MYSHSHSHSNTPFVTLPLSPPPSATQAEVDPNELVRKEWNTPVEPHSDLLMPLLPYQKEGLGWMVDQVCLYTIYTHVHLNLLLTWQLATNPNTKHTPPPLPPILDQECGPVRGGILADEMGMGKTIQAVAAILHNRPLQPHAAGFEEQVHNYIQPTVLTVVISPIPPPLADVHVSCDIELVQHP